MYRVTTRTVRHALAVALLAVAGVLVAPVIANQPPAALRSMTPNVLSDRVSQDVTVRGTELLDARGLPRLLLGRESLFVSSVASCSSSLVPVSRFHVVSKTELSVNIPRWVSNVTGKDVPAYLCYSGQSRPVPFRYATQSATEGGNDVEPNAGPNGGGQPITLFASAAQPWRGAPTVLVGDRPASRVTITNGGRTLTAVTPPNPLPGAGLKVVVRQPGFVDVEMNTRYNSERAVAVTPRGAVLGKPQGITLTGAGFLSGVYAAPGSLHVWIANSARQSSCTQVHVLSDTRATCVIPASAARDHYRIVLGDSPTFGGGTAGSDAVFSTSSVFTVAPY